MLYVFFESDLFNLPNPKKGGVLTDMPIHHFKKQIAIAITSLTLIFSGIVQGVFANPTETPAPKEANFLSSPKEETLATTSAQIVLAGKGTEGDSVKILISVKNDDEYTLENELSFKIESLGLFIKEIELYPGENKVQVLINHKGNETVDTRFIKYNPKSNVDIEKLVRNLDIKKLPLK